MARIKQKANGVMLAELSQNGIKGIVASHGDVLLALFQKERMTMAEVADQIAKDKSTVTALVNKLISQGYVKKQRDYMDARIVYASLTPTGRELQPVFDQISERVQKIFYQSVTEEEKEELLRIITKIDSNFNCFNI
ncbi:MarR family winged helix-turn-helix transcriptional regulator [Anaerotaenia torta]|uniref:MarR family winged helix-turn-helix transcriptional regulator n=1 Tax=Anaerotaenia torta TaxID=433293 RepID=UPI003D24384B